MRPAILSVPPFRRLHPIYITTDRGEGCHYAQALGPNQWAVRTEPGGVQARVTSDCELYEENLEDYELWTYGSCVFPRVALARDDVRDGDYPSSLRRLLGTCRVATLDLCYDVSDERPHQRPSGGRAQRRCDHPASNVDTPRNNDERRAPAYSQRPQRERRISEDERADTRAPG